MRIFDIAQYEVKKKEYEIIKKYSALFQVRISKLMDSERKIIMQGENVNGISNWNVSNLLNMQHMFIECSKLNDPDLKKWKPVKLQLNKDAFTECKFRYKFKTV